MLLGIHDNRHVEYGALFLVTSGTYSAMPVVLCWFAMNLGGHKRRSVGTAYQVGFGNSMSCSFLLAHDILTVIKSAETLPRTLFFREIR